MASVVTKINMAAMGVLYVLSGCVAATHYGAATTALSATGSVVKGEVKEAADHAENFGSAAKEGAYGVVDHVADWMRPAPIKPPQPIASSYCYHSFQDVLCYRAPMPGWENRLIAFQGTEAASPHPATMAALPLQKADPAMLPVNRAANAKPVFATPPSAAKEVEKTGDAAATVVPDDASHEQLPDPSVSPQL